MVRDPDEVHLFEERHELGECRKDDDVGIEMNESIRVQVSNVHQCVDGVVVMRPFHSLRS